MGYRRGLARLLTLVDVPFGYTLTIWGSGAIGADRYGQPTIGHVAAFVAGAMAVYFALAFSTLRVELDGQESDRPAGMALFNVTPVASIALVALLVHFIPSALIGFAAAGSAATASYLAIMGYAWSRSHHGPR